MRFLIKKNDARLKDLLVVPAEVRFSMSDFHRFAHAQSAGSEFNGDTYGNAAFMYSFTHTIETENRHIQLFAKVGQRKILGKYELWQKYRGPKGVEAVLAFPKRYKNTALHFLEELMTNLTIGEYADVDKELEVVGFSEVDQWYRKNYEEQSSVEEKINEILKDKSLPSE